MDKAEFLRHVRADWQRWQAALDELGEARMTQPGVAGDWSVRDVIAHITWSEREMLGVLRQRALAGSELWRLDADQRNAAIYAQNRGRPLADVLQGAQAVHEQLVEALEELPEEHYGNPARFRDMPADWLPWRVLAGNTYEHYEHHLNDVRKWMEQ